MKKKYLKCEFISEIFSGCAVTTSVIYYRVLKCDVCYLEGNYYGLSIHKYCKIGMCSPFVIFINSGRTNPMR